MISPWRLDAAECVAVDEAVICRCDEIRQFGIKTMDAMHIACAEAANCDWFLTTDKGILKKLRRHGNMRLANPIDFVMEDSE